MGWVPELRQLEVAEVRDLADLLGRHPIARMGQRQQQRKSARSSFRRNWRRGLSICNHGQRPAPAAQRVFSMPCWPTSPTTPTSAQMTSERRCAPAGYFAATTSSRSVIRRTSGAGLRELSQEGQAQGHRWVDRPAPQGSTRRAMTPSWQARSTGQRVVCSTERVAQTSPRRGICVATPRGDDRSVLGEGGPLAPRLEAVAHHGVRADRLEPVEAVLRGEDLSASRAQAPGVDAHQNARISRGGKEIRTLGTFRYGGFQKGRVRSRMPLRSA